METCVCGCVVGAVDVYMCTGCVPATRWTVLSSRFEAVERWDAHKCSGFLVSQRAVERAMELADRFGVGVVQVDNAFHYLWGAGWVMMAAEKGYIAMTTCTGAIPEVVPFGGTKPTMGTNPLTFALPTKASFGFDFVLDWATSVLSNGTVKVNGISVWPLVPLLLVCMFDAVLLQGARGRECTLTNSL